MHCYRVKRGKESHTRDVYFCVAVFIASKNTFIYLQQKAIYWFNDYHYFWCSSIRQNPIVFFVFKYTVLNPNKIKTIRINRIEFFLALFYIHWNQNQTDLPMLGDCPHQPTPTLRGFHSIKLFFSNDLNILKSCNKKIPKSHKTW